MADLTQANRLEFQAVVLAGGEGLRLSPLTDGMSKALVPIANRPMIYYSLSMLEAAGFKEVIVVTVRSAAAKIGQYVREHYKGAIEVVIEVVDEQTNSADAIRHIRDRIKTDFMVVSCDLVADVPVSHLADIHRSHNSSLTMLLKELPEKSEEERALAAKKKERSDETAETTEFIGLDEKKQRVLHYSTSAELHDDSMNISKSFLRRCPNIVMTSRLLDSHFYIFSRWVVDLLNQKPKIASLQYDLVPFLVRRQFRSAKYLIEKAGFPESVAQQPQELAFQLTTASYNPEDHIQCYAQILKADGNFCARANTLANYLEINRELARGAVPSFKPENPRVEIPTDGTKVQFSIGKDCIVGTGLQPGDKTSIKKSVIGNHCKLGSNVKIVNSVVMDHVTIMDKCTIQNSVICNGAHIKEDAVLKDCQVGIMAIVESGEFKNESFVQESRR
eukprot:GEZU01029646.1.p1 GENE.GEZU01029646.1~~GEZU01029646.1.p1  ORF type:complete len:463 (+),score=81.03 GEZU01029646.1:51-1391(+)